MSRLNISLSTSLFCKTIVSLNFWFFFWFFFGKLQKVKYQRIWPFLQCDMQTPESLASALQPVMDLIAESTHEEYINIIAPDFR